MRLAEVCLWDTLYVSLYTPIVIMATVIAGAELNLIGFLIVGLVCCAILTGYLCFQGDLFFVSRQRLKPTLQGTPAKLEPKVMGPEAPEVKDEKMEVENPQDKDVGEEVPNTKAEVELSEDPESGMQSDVGLDDLDADDDDSFSKCD